MPRGGRPISRDWLVGKRYLYVENMAKGLSMHDSMIAAGLNPLSGDTQSSIRRTLIKQKIEERKREVAEFCNVTPEQIIGATALRAFATIDDAFNEHGEFDIKKARKTGAIHLIKKLEKKGDNYKVEFYSNADAQEKLGNYLGLDKAPEVTNDLASLKQAIDEVALMLANGQDITQEIRREAWLRVREWIQEKRARYSLSAINEITRELTQ